MLSIPWLLPLIGAGLALAYLPYASRFPSILRTAIKSLSVLCLAGFSAAQDGPILLTGALVFSAMGDLALSRNGERAFLAGMAAFFIAHVLYITLMVTLFPSGGFLAPYWPIGLLLVLYTLGFYALLWPGLGMFRLPVGIYALIILFMGLSALNLIGARGNGWILTGALLFIFSDSILGVEKFKLPQNSPWSPRLSILVWLTYWPAQYILMTALLT